MKIYDSLTRSKEEFSPIDGKKVGIYGCGVTTYKPSHIGHAVQAIVFDMIRRYLEYRGYDVTYVRNYTDVDDKIIAAAKEKGIDPLELSRTLIDIDKTEAKIMGIREPDVAPLASEHIPDIINFIEKLISAEAAYATDAGNVYYRVKSFADYGKLSGQNIEELKEGTRKENEPDKEDVLDFALWKTAKPEEPSWDSPWGKGRPGWHIECSAMSLKYLGEAFDIHGGGSDLKFPHHENEIAQSEALFPGKFAKHWIHNGLLFINGEKMSKSIGNEISVYEWIQKDHPDVLKYLIFSNNYRSQFDFTNKRMRDARVKVYQTYKALALFSEIEVEKADDQIFEGLMKNFEEAMDDDFNTVPVLVAIEEAISAINTATEDRFYKDEEVAAHIKFIQTVAKILGIFDADPHSTLHDMRDLHLKRYYLTRDFVAEKIAERAKHRAQRNFDAADGIARNLREAGITLLDSADSKTTWEPNYTVDD